MESIRIFGGILEVDIIEKNKNRNERKNKKCVAQKKKKISQNQILQLKSHQRNEHFGNPSLVRYFELFLKWVREELRLID